MRPKKIFNIRCLCLFVIGASVFFTASSPASGRISIAVIDLETSSNLSASVGVEISEHIRTHLAHISRFAVMEKKNMDAVLNKQGFLRPSGCRSIECHSTLFDSHGTLRFLEKCGMPDHSAAVEIGIMLKVDKVLIGLINKLEDRYTISVKIIDTATEQVEVTDQISSQYEIHNLEQRIDELAARVSKRIPNNKDARKSSAFSDIDGTQKGQMLNLEGFGEIKDMKDLRSVIQNKITQDRLKAQKAYTDPKGMKLPFDMKRLEEMVLIPAGEFSMGSRDFEGEGPVHKVFIDAFYIDRYEVTNAQFKAFLDATGRRPPPTWGKPGFDLPDQPVIGISWEAALAYAVWAGKRLPSEAEWEKAARGGDGRIYPWGDEWSEGMCQAASKEPSSGPAHVGSHPEGASPYGCQDMAGNIWEWCADWFSSDYYYRSEYKNPKGPKEGSWHVLRGGGWDSPPEEVRTTCRRGGCPDGGYSCAGFRCVKDVIDKKEEQ